MYVKYFTNNKSVMNHDNEMAEEFKRSNRVLFILISILYSAL